MNGSIVSIRSQNAHYLKESYGCKSILALFLLSLTGCFGGVLKLGPLNPSLKSESLSISGVTTGEVGTCLKYVVTTLDTSSKVRTLEKDTVVNLSGSTFYIDSSCLILATSMTIPKTSSFATFYMKDTKAGSISIGASLSSGGSGTLAVSLLASGPDHLSVSVDPMFGTVATAIIIVPKVVDRYENGVAGVSLSFSVLTGGGSISSLNVTSDSAGLAQNSFTLGTVIGTDNNSVGVSSPIISLPDLAGSGRTTLTFLESAFAGAADPSLSILTLSSGTVAAGSSVTATVSLRDAFNNPIEGVIPTLASSTSGTSFILTTPTDATGTTTGQVSPTLAGVSTISISSPSGIISTASLTVTAGAASKFVFGSFSPATPSTTTCTQVTVRSTDNYGNPVNVGSVLSISLSASGGTTTYYTTAACASPTTSASISAGTSSSFVWFRDTSAEYVTLSGTSSGAYSSSAASSSIPVSTPLGFTGPPSGALNTCNGPFYITAPSVISPSTATSLTLGFTGTGGYAYSDSNCLFGNTTTNIPGNATSSTAFYFKSDRISSYTLSANLNNPHPLFTSPTSVPFNSIAGSPADLILSGKTYVAPAACSPIKMTFVDNAHNVTSSPTTETVTLSGAGSGLFYSDSLCTDSLPGSISVSGGVSSATFYFKDGVSENLTISATPSSFSAPSSTFGISVTNSPPSVQISVGVKHACTLVNGGVFCWGSGISGQLGNGTNSNSFLPTTAMPSGSDATSVSAGYDHTCAVIAGNVQCWGGNSFGSLGNGGSSATSTPVAVSGIAGGATLVSSGFNHTCAVVSGGIRCWGKNDKGQVGDGSISHRYSPQIIFSNSSSATAVHAGYNSTCAVVNGAALCWGENDYGQLGNGTIGGPSNVPVQVSGLTTGVTAIAAGYRFSCAVVSGGVKCWGKNSGNLGDNNVCGSSCSTPVIAIASGSGVIAVGAGQSHACALKSDGSVLCWGSANSVGQLGNGTTNPSAVPVAVSGLGAGSGVTQIGVAMADEANCAILGSNMKCWGANLDGQLGLGVLFAPPVTYSTTPVSGVSMFFP